MSDPDETAPFTHQPYGAPPPPPAGPGVPPPYSSQPTGPYVGSLDHPGAKTAMWLGIVALGALALGIFCCVTAPLVLCAPFAWGLGVRARREIDAQPGRYANRGQAQAAVVMGMIGSALGLLAAAAFTALFVWLGVADPSLV